MPVPKLDDEFLRPIGRISNSFAHLEFMARLCAWRLIEGPPDPSLLATAGMGFRQVVETVRRLQGFRAQQGRWSFGDISGMLERAGRAADERNSVLHSAFWPVARQREIADAAYAWSRRRKGRPPYKFHVTVERLEEIAEGIEAVAEEVEKLYVALSIEAETGARGQTRNRQVVPPD